MKEKTYVEDVDRNMYDFRNDEKDAYRIKNGLTEDIVEKISEEKHDPEWMHDFRLNSLKIYHEMKVPDWGPSIEGLNMDNIATYVRANTKMKGDWSEVPEEIKDTFEKLGIPQAERTSLAGVGAQYDSELVYHNVRKEVAEQGVIYTDMESALTGKYADMVKDHFMKLVTPHDHKFAALHGAVWSGGSFVYVPEGVSVEIPLQSYFRLNAAGAVGNEKEDVLLLDDNVVNQTIPLILCAEEDVEGNHGATIGKLDEDLVFYLESRGMALAEIYKMMAKARIDAVLRFVPDEKTKADVASYLESEGSNGCK